MAAYPDKLPTMAELRTVAKDAVQEAQALFIEAEQDGYADDEEWVNGVEVLIGYSDAYRQDGYRYQFANPNNDYHYDWANIVTYWARVFVEPGAPVSAVASEMLSALKAAIKSRKPIHDPDRGR